MIPWSSLGNETKETNANVALASFGPSDATYRSWRQENDPVMGGMSSGSFKMDSGFGTMEGTVADVPSLGAPGFINTAASGTYANYYNYYYYYNYYNYYN